MGVDYELLDERLLEVNGLRDNYLKLIQEAVSTNEQFFEITDAINKYIDAMRLYEKHNMRRFF